MIVSGTLSRKLSCEVNSQKLGEFLKILHGEAGHGGNLSHPRIIWNHFEDAPNFLLGYFFRLRVQWILGKCYAPNGHSKSKPLSTYPMYIVSIIKKGQINLCCTEFHYNPRALRRRTVKPWPSKVKGCREFVHVENTKTTKGGRITHRLPIKLSLSTRSLVHTRQK
jgi:hypothetical protein